jgi:hypothetical protein
LLNNRESQKRNPLALEFDPDNANRASTGKATKDPGGKLDENLINLMSFRADGASVTGCPALSVVSFPLSGITQNKNHQ